MNLNQTSHKLRNFLAGWIGITLLAMAAGAVSPQTWRISTFNDFSDGESERVSIQHPGEIRLAPSIQPFAEVKESAIWSLAASPDGGTLYAGTGNSAKIYRIAGTPGTATAEARLFADLDGNTVHALLIGSDGALYAGVSPGGSVYKISDEGAVTLIGASGQDYIWAMVQDATGDLILATGDKGQILRMALDGKTKTLVKTGEKHILSLVKNADGKIYFGTASNGWVAELVNEKDFRVLYDSDLGEVKSLALAPDGTLYAGIIPTVQVDAKRDVPQPTPAPPSPKTDKSSEIVKITPDGLARLLDKTPGAAANAMLVADQGLLVGSGDEGKLFRVGYRDETGPGFGSAGQRNSRPASPPERWCLDDHWKSGQSVHSLSATDKVEPMLRRFWMPKLPACGESSTGSHRFPKEPAWLLKPALEIQKTRERTGANGRQPCRSRAKSPVRLHATCSGV
ncbi:MAG: hypothetical protein IPI28_00715 [Candidatus Omnitrophica bacterium]|nr:hypothetical protein [Candidatus Omnitrophota bacterium]